MVNYIIPSIVLYIIIYGYYKKVDIYDNFLEGVLEGVKLAFKIFPNIFAMTVSINVLVRSNIINDLALFLEPIMTFLHFPSEVLPLALMRSISGNSSLLIFDNILKENGADSFIGRVASVMQGSSDTTFYIISLYFSSVGIKNIKYALIVGLLADLTAVILSVVVVNLLF